LLPRYTNVSNILHPPVIFDQFKNIFHGEYFKKWNPRGMFYKNKHGLQKTVATVFYSEMVVSA
jgi:hypothetical protein